MKKIAFTLGAVTAVCACSLFIDPDKLVEGGATPIDPGSDGGADATTTDGATSDGAVDAGTDGPTLVEIPECVPAAPTGTQGPYAVTYGAVETKVACPAGYLATPITTAKGNLGADAIVCGDATGCGCSASGTPTCSLRLRYFVDNQCTIGKGSDPLTASCLDIDSESYLRVDTVVTGVSCTNTGAMTVAPTVKPTPAYREDWVVCAPDPSVPLAQCKMDQIALPPAKNAGACVVTSGPTCPAPYTEDIGVSKSGTFTDSRACACSCGAGAASCTGGSATIFSEDNCNGNSKPFALDTCLPRGGDDGMTAVVPTPAAGPACAAKVAPTGTLQPNDDLHLCCLP